MLAWVTSISTLAFMLGLLVCYRCEGPTIDRVILSYRAAFVNISK